MNLNDREWKLFFIGELFTVERPNARNKDDYEYGTVPFVASGCVNNGVLTCCKPQVNEQLDKSNCITVSPVDGSSFFHPYSFLGRGGAGSSVLMLYNSYLNIFNGLFIARCVSHTCTEKYNYGHMGNKDSIKRERIILPVDKEGNPDYKFMEDYIRELMERKRKQYYIYAEKEIKKLKPDLKIRGGYNP